MVITWWIVVFLCGVYLPLQHDSKLSLLGACGPVDRASDSNQ